MKKVIQYSIICSIAFVMFVGGFFSYSMIGQQNENSLAQSLALGGYGVVKAYHADGTLFYEWEGHNALVPRGIHVLTSCFSGVGLPFNTANLCTGGIFRIDLTDKVNDSNFQLIDSASSVQTILPVGCDPGSANPLCTGWSSRGTLDFSNLICTPGVDCPTFNEVNTRLVGLAPFNSLDVTPQEITPGDIIVVTITFSPS